ncbi:MAG: peptidylprolyl isomerase [Anaerolineae bacterium]|nr:peptidylprolyl isomerase [Anaerolineae bacterium]
MSKRSTTGLPKPAQPKPEPESKSRLQPKLLREYRSKHEREIEIQRLILIGTLITVGIAALILLVAVLNDQLLVPNQAVATVNGETITVGEFKTRAKIERALLIQQLDSALSLYSSLGYTTDQLSQLITSQQPYSTWYGQLQITDQLGNSVLNTMVEDELVRQKAQELGITVTEDDLNAEIAKLFGYDPATAGIEPTASPSPTPSHTPLVSPTPSPVPSATLTPTPGEVTGTPTVTPLPSATPSSTPNATEIATQAAERETDFFAQIRTLTGASDADIRDYFRMNALRDKVRDAVITDVTRTAPYVDARHILVATEEEANNALAALQNGESFAALASAISTDGSASSGGELGWAPASNYVTEFADAVKTAEIGALVGPVKTDFGYHIIQVRARDDREMTDTEFEQAKNQAFSEYLTNLRQSADTNVVLYDAWTDNVPTEPVWVPQI